MKILNLLKGKETKELATSLPVYRVSWRKIADTYGYTSFSTKDAVRFFTSEDEANEFAQQLRQAHKLLESYECEETEIIVTKDKEGGL